MNMLRKLSTLFLLVCMNNACATVGMFNISSIEGRVVDKDTQSPIEGAVVVAKWAIKARGWAGSTRSGHLLVQAVLTNTDGHYFIPSLGTVKVDDYVDGSAPQLTVFKEGYAIKIVSNTLVPNDGTFERKTMSDRELEYNRGSVWNGRAITLEKFKGSEDDYINQLTEAARNYVDGYYVTPTRTNREHRPKCNWIGVDAPLWFKMIDREIKKIRPTKDLSGLIQGHHDNYKDCGRWEAFYKVFNP